MDPAGSANAFLRDGESARQDSSRVRAWPERVLDYRRHIQDLRTRSYEGASSRTEREEVFRRAFDLTTPVARRVLEDLSASFLKGTGQFEAHPPQRVEEGGLLGRWTLDWPQLRSARSRFSGRPLEPIALYVIFPVTATGAMQWTHPHLALLRRDLPERPEGMAAAWPFQVTSAEDADRQEPILRVLAEAEMHERTFEADLNWRILTFALDD